MQVKEYVFRTQGKGRFLTSSSLPIGCNARTTAVRPSNIKTAFGTQLNMQKEKGKKKNNHLSNATSEENAAQANLVYHLWLIIDITGYSPVPRGLSSGSHMV